VTESPKDRLPAIPGLLDDGLLSGYYETTTILRPERPARPVATNDLIGALTEIEFACQVWGGGSQPLLPVANGMLPDPYRKLLATEQIDFVGGLQEIELALLTRVEARRPWNHPAILAAASKPLEGWSPVQVVDLDTDDPWRPVYTAVLGTWPERPDPRLLDFAGLREDLRFEEIVPVERVTAEGSLQDLIARTADRDHLTPRTVANAFLAYGLRPDTSFLGHTQAVLPNPRTIRRAAGPNLIVAVTPGSVEDVALLWNLRGAHGESRAMPIGVPVEQITPNALRELQEPGRATMFGLGGGACHVVTASVPLRRLEELAAQSPNAKAVPYDAVLTFGPAPGRPRSHVSQWQDGWTRLDPMSDSDREVLRESRLALRAPALVLDVTVDGYPLPADPTMRGSELYGRFQAGAAQVKVSEMRDQQTVQVQWPSSWTSLAAVAQTRGLNISASEPGLAASTLIRALGSLDAIRLLQHRPLIALVYRMAERSGMSWWKKRWTAALRELSEAGTDPTTLDRAAALLGRDDPAVAPPGEGRAVPFQEFVAALGTEAAATHWVAWGERRHLLVRGSDVTCPDCKTQSWLPLAALPPPVPCPGCGRQIDQPYNPRALTFTYRLGEPLRRVLETDSLGHVLALHWFDQLFDRAGLVGAHPGVTFTDPVDKGKTIGEADVLLLFSDGSLVPVEVKRRLAGAEDRTVQLMDTLAEALDAPWDALAVTEPARDIPSLAAMERRLPDRPRLLLTDDQLHAHYVFWALGQNPFKWDPHTTELDHDRERAFTEWLSANDPDVPWDSVADPLLDRALGAPQTKAGDGPSSGSLADERRSKTRDDATSDGEP
jgi:hypothetical protein